MWFVAAVELNRMFTKDSLCLKKYSTVLNDLRVQKVTMKENI